MAYLSKNSRPSILKATIKADFKYIVRHPVDKLKYQPFSEGPDHKKVSKAAVCLNGKELAQGIGCTKKRAEMDAARKALLELPAR